MKQFNESNNLQELKKLKETSKNSEDLNATIKKNNS